jgi:hypothetical protein
MASESESGEESNRVERSTVLTATWPRPILRSRFLPKWFSGTAVAARKARFLASGMTRASYETASH